MYGFGKYFAYLGSSILTAVEICYLVTWISSSHFNTSDLWMIPLGAFWVLLVAIPTWVLLAPAFWIVLAICCVGLAFVVVRRVDLTIKGVLMSSTALLVSTVLAALVWLIVTPTATVHRFDTAIYFCFGGVIASAVFGLLSARYLRKHGSPSAASLPY